MKICTVGALGANRNTRRKARKPESDDLGTRSSDHKRSVTRPKSPPIRSPRRIRSKETAVAPSRQWELGDWLNRVLGQRGDTPDNEKWSGRWNSHPDPNPLSLLGFSPP